MSQKEIVTDAIKDVEHTIVDVELPTKVMEEPTQVVEHTTEVVVHQVVVLEQPTEIVNNTKVTREQASDLEESSDREQSEPDEYGFENDSPIYDHHSLQTGINLFFLLEIARYIIYGSGSDGIIDRKLFLCVGLASTLLIFVLGFTSYGARRANRLQIGKVVICGTGVVHGLISGLKCLNNPKLDIALVGILMALCVHEMAKSTGFAFAFRRTNEISIGAAVALALDLAVIDDTGTPLMFQRRDMALYLSIMLSLPRALTVFGIRNPTFHKFHKDAYWIAKARLYKSTSVCKALFGAPAVRRKSRKDRMKPYDFATGTDPGRSPIQVQAVVWLAMCTQAVAFSGDMTDLDKCLARGASIVGIWIASFLGERLRVEWPIFPNRTELTKVGAMLVFSIPCAAIVSPMPIALLSLGLPTWIMTGGFGFQSKRPDAKRDEKFAGRFSEPPFDTKWYLQSSAILGACSISIASCAGELDIISTTNFTRLLAGSCVILTVFGLFVRNEEEVDHKIDDYIPKPPSRGKLRHPAYATVFTIILWMVSDHL